MSHFTETIGNRIAKSEISQVTGRKFLPLVLNKVQKHFVLCEEVEILTPIHIVIVGRNVEHLFLTEIKFSSSELH